MSDDREHTCPPKGHEMYDHPDAMCEACYYGYPDTRPSVGSKTVALAKALDLILASFNRHIGTDDTPYAMHAEEVLSLMESGASASVQDQVSALFIVRTYGMMHNIARRLQHGGVFNPLKEIDLLEEQYPSLQKTYLEICNKNQILLNPSKD